MKICLIIPPGFNQSQKVFMPFLGLGTLASYLRKRGIQVEICDLSEEDVPRNPENIMKKINFKGYDVIAFSLLNRQSSKPIHFTLRMSKILKEKKDIPIVLGGAYSEVGKYSEIFLKIMGEYLFIDYCIDATFSGEVPFYLLCQAIRGSFDLKSVPNLIYRENNKVQTTGWQFNRKIICPDFDGFPLLKYRNNNKSIIGSAIKKDFENARKDILILPYQLMMGCKYNCAFCLKYDKNVEMKKPSLVAFELKKLSRKYNTRYFYFLDRTINMDYSYLNSLCDELIKNKTGILWTDCAYLGGIDFDLAKKMRKAGLIRLIFGLESASERLLGYLNKNIKLKDAADILEYCNTAGIWNITELITGFPHEDEADVEKTISFLKKNKDNIDGTYLNTFELKTPSLIQQSPLKYGIKNVCPLKHKIGCFTYTYGNSYDEINGMLWNEKQRQAQKYKNKLKDMLKNSIFIYSENTNQDDMPNLFYLYSILKKKKRVKKHYNPLKESVFGEIFPGYAK